MTQPYPMTQESSVVFGILHHVFFTEPSEAYLHKLFAEDLLQLWPEELITPEGREAHRTLLIQAQQPDTTYLETLEKDFARLFVGPERKLAYPWGSYYTDKYQLLNGDSTHALHTFLRSNAIELNLNSNELPDHIGLIFAVIASLFANGNWQRDQTVIKALLEDHLLPWVNRFIDNVVEHGVTDYYRGFAELARGIIDYWQRELKIAIPPETASIVEVH